MRCNGPVVGREETHSRSGCSVEGPGDRPNGWEVGGNSARHPDGLEKRRGWVGSPRPPLQPSKS